jgi:hypothetical protein
MINELQKFRDGRFLFLFFILSLLSAPLHHYLHVPPWLTQAVAGMGCLGWLAVNCIYSWRQSKQRKNVQNINATKMRKAKQK